MSDSSQFVHFQNIHIKSKCMKEQHTWSWWEAAFHKRSFFYRQLKGCQVTHAATCSLPPELSDTVTVKGHEQEVETVWSRCPLWCGALITSSHTRQLAAVKALIMDHASALMSSPPPLSVLSVLSLSSLSSLCPVCPLSVLCVLSLSCLSSLCPVCPLSVLPVLSQSD